MCMGSDSCVQCVLTTTGHQQERQQLYDAIAAAQSRLHAAQRRRDLAVRDLHRAKTELERLRAGAKASKSTKQRLGDAAAAEANWVAARPHPAALLAMTAGPLTTQVSSNDSLCDWDSCCIYAVYSLF